MATTTRLTHPVAPRDRVVPVASTDGFRDGDGATLGGEPVVVRRVNSDRSMTVDRGEAPRAHWTGDLVARDE